MKQHRLSRVVPICAFLIACQSSTAPAVILPVELSVTGVVVSPPSAAIVSVGDQVVATIVGRSVCGSESGASAALDHGKLTVTVSLISELSSACSATSGTLIYRVTVDGAPSGTYDATLHLRVQGFSSSVDSTLATSRVTIP